MAVEVFAEWQDKYKTGIAFIDEQHKRLVETMNSLYHGLNDKSKNRSDVFREAALQAVEYVKKHFSEEEAWMRDSGYGDYERQKKDHAYFVKKLVDDSKSFSDCNPKAAFDFVFFLRDWLLSHIAVEDNNFRFHKAKLDDQQGRG